MANISDQWLLEGDCKKCRRAKCCSKPCTKNMNASRAMDKLDMLIKILSNTNND